METSNTLLESLQAADPKACAWARLIKSYDPFVRRVLVAKGLTGHAIDDIVQNVMAIVARRVPEFERQRTGSFRSWLRAITANCLRDHWRSLARRPDSVGTNELQDLIKDMEDPRSEFTQTWNREHAHHILARLLEAVDADFEPRTIEIFSRLALHDENVDDVANRFDTTPNACFIARSRVMKRLRQLLRDLFGDDDVLFELMA